MSRRIILRTAAVLSAVMLAGGCVKQPFDESALAPTEDLGAAAAPLDSAEEQRVGAVSGKRRKAKRSGTQVAAADAGNAGTAASGSGPAAGGGAPAGQRSSGGGDGARSRRQAAVTQPPPGFSRLLDASDPADDASGRSPRYADVQRVMIESNGRTARVAVAMGGDIPGALAEGEVQGVGVDFFRSDAGDSDYQLFALGNVQGWRAYLHTPDGLTSYPGTFRLGGGVLLFELPWAALGGTASAGVSVFVDWSKERTVLNAIGHDRAPRDGRFTVHPAR